MILHLGVVDIPYTDEGVTTGEVAETLEENYEVMGGFVELNKLFIAQSLESSLAGTLENLLIGGTVPESPFNSGTQKIEQRFREFLDHEEITQLGRPGVPTKAALMGKSARFKKGFGPRRPSFIDTGLYQSSFKTWVE